MQLCKLRFYMELKWALRWPHSQISKKLLSPTYFICLITQMQFYCNHVRAKVWEVCTMSVIEDGHGCMTAQDVLYPAVSIWELHQTPLWEDRQPETWTYSDFKLRVHPLRQHKHQCMKCSMLLQVVYFVWIGWNLICEWFCLHNVLQLTLCAQFIFETIAFALPLEVATEKYSTGRQ